MFNFTITSDRKLLMTLASDVTDLKAAVDVLTAAVAATPTSQPIDLSQVIADLEAIKLQVTPTT